MRLVRLRGLFATDRRGGRRTGQDCVWYRQDPIGSHAINNHHHKRDGSRDLCVGSPVVLVRGLGMEFRRCMHFPRSPAQATGCACAGDQPARMFTKERPHRSGAGPAVTPAEVLYAETAWRAPPHPIPEGGGWRASGFSYPGPGCRLDDVDDRKRVTARVGRALGSTNTRRRGKTEGILNARTRTNGIKRVPP